MKVNERNGTKEEDHEKKANDEGRISKVSPSVSARHGEEENEFGEEEKRTFYDTEFSRKALLVEAADIDTESSVSK